MNEGCLPTRFLWVRETYASTAGPSQLLLNEGLSTWFLIVDDVFMHDGHIWPDGRLIHGFYVWQVKSPSDLKAAARRDAVPLPEDLINAHLDFSA